MERCSITNHFEINPVNGGSPPSESRVINNGICICGAIVEKDNDCRIEDTLR